MKPDLIIDIETQYSFNLSNGNVYLGNWDSCTYYKKDYGVLVELRNEFSERKGKDIKCAYIERIPKKITCRDVI